MKKILKQTVQVILTVLLSVIVITYIWQVYSTYSEMMMYGQISGVKEFFEIKIKYFTYIYFATILLGLIGNIIRKLVGWIFTLHMFYFLIVYSVITYMNAYVQLLTLTVLLLTLVLLLLNSKIMRGYYKVGSKNALLINLTVAVFTLTEMIMLSDWFVR
jgi:hypothetical protein